MVSIKASVSLDPESAWLRAERVDRVRNIMGTGWSMTWPGRPAPPASQHRPTPPRLTRSCLRMRTRRTRRPLPSSKDAGEKRLCRVYISDQTGILPNRAGTVVEHFPGTSWVRFSNACSAKLCTDDLGCEPALQEVKTRSMRCSPANGAHNERSICASFSVGRTSHDDRLPTTIPRTVSFFQLCLVAPSPG